MDKKMIEQLLEVLADKTLSFGCEIEHQGEGKLIFICQKYCQKKEHDSEYGCDDVDYCNNLACLKVSENRIIYGNCWTPYRVIGHPLTFSRVKQKIAEKLDTLNNQEFECLNELDRLWLPFGYETTFGEIIEASGWEDVEMFKDCGCGDINCMQGSTFRTERLRDPNACALVSFLASLFLTGKHETNKIQDLGSKEERMVRRG